MKNKFYKLNVFSKPMKVCLIKEKYSNGRPCILMLDKRGESICDVSVNIPRESVTDSSNCAFVDVNNCPWLIMFLIKNGIAMPTGIIGYSGFCEYPEYYFNLDKLINSEEVE